MAYAGAVTNCSTTAALAASFHSALGRKAATRLAMGRTFAVWESAFCELGVGAVAQPIL